MIQVNDLTPDRWSYYEEFLKNRSIQKAIEQRPELENTIVLQIQNGDIEAAADVRKIGKIASDKTKKGKKIISDYANGEVDVYSAFSSLQKSGNFDKVYEKVTDFRNYIIDSSFKNNILSSAKKDDILFCIKKISKVLKDLQKEIEDGQ